MRIFWAAVFAPALFPLWTLLSTWLGTGDLWTGILAAGMPSFFLYPISWVVGLPLALLLAGYSYTRKWPFFAALGALLGLATMLLLGAPLQNPVLMNCLIVGVQTGVTFFFLAGYHKK